MARSARRPSAHDIVRAMRLSTAAAVVSLAAASGITATASPARAQDPGASGSEPVTVTAAGSRAARRAFEQAMESMDAGLFDVAVERFRESIALEPRASTAFNLALALRGAGRVRDALDVIEGLRGGRYGALAGAQRRDVETRRREIEGDLATLRIRLDGPRDAELRIDGTLVERDPASVTLAHRVDPGAHVITASATDHQTAEREVTAPRGGEVEVAIALAPVRDTRPGVLLLEGADPSLDVAIVGIASGRGTVRAELPPGEYAVRATSGNGSRESRIEVPPGRTVRLVLDAPSGRSVLEEPWLWITAGAVLLVGAGVTIGAVVASEPQPVSDPVFGVIVALESFR
jgi:hypothetical protein